MGKFYDRVEKNAASSGGGKWFAAMSAVHPTLSEALQGMPNKGSGRGGVPGLSVLLFADDGRLKIRLQLRGKQLVAFTTIEYQADLWKLLDDLLEGDSLEWREDAFPVRARQGK